MGWIRTILDALLQLFRWRANATDPKLQVGWAYQKKHDDWEKWLRRLEDEETKAREDYGRYVAYANPLRTAESDRLRGEYLAASLAVGRHRASEPKRDDH